MSPIDAADDIILFTEFSVVFMNSSDTPLFFSSDFNCSNVLSTVAQYPGRVINKTSIRETISTDKKFFFRIGYLLIKQSSEICPIREPRIYEMRNKRLNDRFVIQKIRPAALTRKKSFRD